MARPLHCSLLISERNQHFGKRNICDMFVSRRRRKEENEGTTILGAPYLQEKNEARRISFVIFRFISR
jgi:hypothetical protein